MKPKLSGFDTATGCKNSMVKGYCQGLLVENRDLNAQQTVVQEAVVHACCTPFDLPRAAASCPVCGTEGRPVKLVTLRSLLKPHLCPEARDEVYRFCANPECKLVYYSTDGAQTFARTDLTVRVGVKESSAPRPLCYCFDHSAESIREDWVQTGKSTILESIKAEVKAGNCRCEVTNPSGGCCLGDVIKEVKVIAAAPAAPGPTHDYCSSTTPPCC